MLVRDILLSRSGESQGMSSTKAVNCMADNRRFSPVMARSERHLPQLY
jgi:hypothetical protein